MSDRAERASEPPRGRLIAREHDAFGGTPYYDEELGVPQSKAHRIMAVETSAVLAAVCREAGLSYLSDEPIWYLHPESDEQKAYFGDCVIGKPVDSARIVASDLLFVLEVVSTQDRRKELKDTRFQRLLNEYNAVPEFALAFPEPDDARALTFCRLVDGEYHEHVLGPGARVASASVPGLELAVLAREQWSEGHKVDVYYRGERRPRLAGERARAEQERERAEQERERAEQERERAEQERERAEQERERADRLAERLRALGVDPDDA
ncbi:MAG: hypothetical protein AB7S26_18355 [Sandaracinaceae bacterium]